MCGKSSVSLVGSFYSNLAGKQCITLRPSSSSRPAANACSPSASVPIAHQVRLRRTRLSTENLFGGFTPCRCTFGWETKWAQGQPGSIAPLLAPGASGCPQASIVPLAIRSPPTLGSTQAPPKFPIKAHVQTNFSQPQLQQKFHLHPSSRLLSPKKMTCGNYLPTQ